MFINRIIRQALPIPDLQGYERQDDFMSHTGKDYLDTRKISFKGGAKLIGEETQKQSAVLFPDKLILHVNLLGISHTPDTTAERFDNGRSMKESPVYSIQSAYSRDYTNLMQISCHSGVEVTYVGTGSALFTIDETHRELSIVNDKISEKGGYLLLPKNNVLYKKPFAMQTNGKISEKWNLGQGNYFNQTSDMNGKEISVIINLHAYGGSWQKDADPKDIEQTYFQIGNQGGRTTIITTRSSFWDARGIDPIKKVNQISGKLMSCQDNLTHEESISLEKAITEGFIEIKLKSDSGGEFSYKSFQIVRSVIGTSTFDLYFAINKEE